MSYWSPILSLQFQNSISSENQVGFFFFFGSYLVIKPNLILIHLMENLIWMDMRLLVIFTCCTWCEYLQILLRKCWCSIAWIDQEIVSRSSSRSHIAKMLDRLSRELKQKGCILMRTKDIFRIYSSHLVSRTSLILILPLVLIIE